MTNAIGTPHDFTSFGRGRLSRKASSQSAFGAVALAISVLVSASMYDVRPTAAPSVDEAPSVAPKRIAGSNTYVALLDPAFSLGFAPVSLGQTSPLGSNFESSSPASPVTVAEPENVLPTQAVPELIESVPLPTPRPPEFRSLASQGPFRASGRQMAQQNRTTARLPNPSDNRTFFEKFFGIEQPSGSALAYAAPESDVLGNVQRLTSGPEGSYDRWTAVYDITAHTVYMPNGARLEAHSGLGDKLDDPRHVNERMRGATPPHVYDLEPRAQLFHGVRALRLNPVGGGGGIFGRTGLLAHTYMLGPNGDSNGCVSFKNYDAFLQAFLNGEVRRLVVVARLA